MSDQMPPEKDCDDSGCENGQVEWENPDGSKEWLDCTRCGGTGKVLA
jgi:hypothetical protein